MKKILKHNKLIIGLILIITLFFLFQLPDVEINNDIEVFLPDDNPAKMSNDNLREIFGESEGLVTAVQVDQGTVFEAENLKLIANLSSEIEELQQVEEVRSLTNVDYIAGSSEGMVVESLIEEIPENREQRIRLKEKILSWDFYQNNLYSDDFKSTQILITLEEGLSADQEKEIFYQVKDVVNSYQGQGIKTFISGSKAINVLMGDHMLQDIRYLIPIIFLVLILALYFFFQKALPVFLVMLTVSISSIWAVGLMAYLGINLTLVSTVIPVLLLAVGSAYGIHILSHYYDALAELEQELTAAKNEELILATVNQLGKPVFLAALTTVVGFGSLASSQIVPIKSFGIFTAIGIIAAFLIALFLIPSLLKLPIFFKDKKNSDFDKLEHFESLIFTVHDFYSQKRISIILTVLLIIIISALGFNKIVVDTPLIEMFKEESEIRQADDFINQNFAGTNIMKVLIEGKERGSLNNPEILNEMDKLQQSLESNFESVGKTSSISDYIKRMNQVMHYPEAESEEIEAETKTNQNSSSEENTSSFYQESSTESQTESESETTSSFYQEDGREEDNSDGSSSFYQGEDSEVSEEAQEEKSQPEIIAGPDSEKNISELEFIQLLNRAVAGAEKLDLTADQLLQLLKEEMNYNAAAYYEIPNNLEKYDAETKENLKNLISQYLLLFSGSVDDLINDQLEPDKAQMLIQIKDPSNITAARIKNKIDNYSSSNFPADYQTTVSGYATMALEANNLIVGSQIRSIVISFIVVFIIVAISFKSIIAGFYGIIPLAFSLIINFGLMGHLGIKLDVGTAMVASIAIGIGVDYTIHFLHSYHQNRRENDDLYQVTRKTLSSTGKAIIFNAISVAAGFLVLLFSNFYPLVYLGLLIAVTMFTSSLAAMTILPLLLNIFKPEFIKKAN
ncbi:efflux RND transporter permease subunit [Halanaerobium saccharolyticum]|uniref:efflux RND transporter permease subunit n=1 Tax=Halanaerobium saccharolyticum TaxID=43595 RepID=UPI003FCD23E8